MASVEDEDKNVVKKKTNEKHEVKPILPDQILKSAKGDEYIVESRLGAGGFGEVWKVSLINDPEKRFAMKTEQNVAQMKKMLRLKMEVSLFEAIAQASNRIDKTHFVKMHDKGKTADFKYMIMDLIWLSLKDIQVKFCGGEFSAHTKIKIARQSLKAIQSLHEIGYIHRDLKPENLAVGLPPRDSVVYLLDFGIARCFKDDDGKVKVARKRVQWMGTLLYASIESLCENEQSMRDDLEVWLYVMLEFYDKMNLCWSWCELSEKQMMVDLRNDLMGKPRELHADGRLKAPLKWIDIIELLNKMGYGDYGDFTRINLLLTQMCIDENIDENLPFDWAGKRPKSPEKPKRKVVEKKKDEKKDGKKDTKKEEKKGEKRDEKRGKEGAEKRKTTEDEDEKDRKPRRKRQTEDASKETASKSEESDSEEYKKYLKWKNDKFNKKTRTREEHSDRNLRRPGSKASVVKKKSRVSKSTPNKEENLLDKDVEATEVDAEEMKIPEKKEKLEVKKDAVTPAAIKKRERTRENSDRDVRLRNRKKGSTENVKKQSKVSKKEDNRPPTDDEVTEVDAEEMKIPEGKEGKKEPNENREQEKENMRKNRVRKQESNEKNKNKGTKKSINTKATNSVEEKDKFEKKNDKDKIVQKPPGGKSLEPLKKGVRKGRSVHE